MRLILSLLLILSAQTFLSVGIKAQSQAPSCPSITIRDEDGYEVSGLVSIGKLTFTLNTVGSTLNDKPSYWKVSGGRIVDGQGSSTITVETGDSIGAEITATLDVSNVSGLSPQCDKIVSARVRVGELFCPRISISCPTDIVMPGVPVTISVNISGGNPHANPKYEWVVSTGKITSGQGTPAITIDTTGTINQDVSATVEIEGYPPECDKSASCKFSVIGCGLRPPAMKFDEYDDLSWKNEGSRLDNFAIQLQQQVGSMGHIIIYGPQRIDQRIARVRDYLVGKRGIDPDRITLVNGGHNKKARTELWVVPTGAEPPKPDPNY